MKKYVVLLLSVSLLIILSSVIQSVALNYQKITMVLELYEKENFGGKKIVIAVDTPDLEEYCFDDKTNAIKVFKGPNYEGGSRVKVYSGKNYKGGYIELTALQEIKSLEKEQGFGNTISSIKFPY